MKVQKQPMSFLRADLLKTGRHADEAALVLAPPDVLEVADALTSLQSHGCQAHCYGRMATLGVNVLCYYGQFTCLTLKLTPHVGRGAA